LWLCAAVAWAAFMMSKSLPYWPINPTLSPNPWITFQIDLLRSLGRRIPRRRFSGERASHSRSPR
jgi:spermidine synthase